MKKILFVIGILIVLLFAGVVGWSVGHKSAPATPSSSGSSGASSPGTAQQNSTSGNEVKNRISFSVPDGWRESACPGRSDTLYFVPPAENLSCGADSSAPVGITLSPQSQMDCQQLQNQQNVSKHTCKSLYIDGKKTLQSSTTYTAGSSYGRQTTISKYYIMTGSDTVVVTYRYSADNKYQSGFEQLAQSVSVKQSR